MRNHWKQNENLAVPEWKTHLTQEPDGASWLQVWNDAIFVLWNEWSPEGEAEDHALVTGNCTTSLGTKTVFRIGLKTMPL